jgi:RNA polymerase sigma-70 factor (ECF subfamily)
MQLPIAPFGMRPRVDRDGSPTRSRTNDADPARAALDPVEFARRLAEAAPRLVRFARRLCGRADGADDLCQDTARRALERRDRYDPSRPIVPWLCRVAFRLWLDRRARITTSVAPESLADRSRDPSEALRLREAVARLPRIERELLVGFHVRGDSIAELASRFAMPENTVKSHLHRARRRLADELEERHGCR